MKPQMQVVLGTFFFSFLLSRGNAASQQFYGQLGREKKKKDKNYREQNFHPRSPPCSCLSHTPSPPFQLGGPSYPTPPALQGHLGLFGFATPFPPAHPKHNVNPGNNPLPGQSPSQEPWVGAWTSRCSPTASPLEHRPHPRRHLMPRPQGQRLRVSRNSVFRNNNEKSACRSGRVGDVSRKKSPRLAKPARVRRGRGPARGL